MSKLRFAVVVVLLLMLAACATQRSRPHGAATPEALAGQDAREAALSSLTHWTIDARIAVSGENGGSGDLTWRQDGSAYTFSVRAPNGKTLRLTGDRGRAMLEGVDPQPDIGIDPERLLKERLGTEVPFAALDAWVLGLRAPGSSAQVQFDQRGLPALIEQDGWTVEYLDWFTDRTPALPKNVRATRLKDKVKLIIQTWTFDDQTK
jgi:outer membrane lipoprotein LolB